LSAIDTGFYGALDNWIAAAQRLHQDRRIDVQTLDQIRLISSFADLHALESLPRTGAYSPRISAGA
jgi:hypothetical protein